MKTRTIFTITVAATITILAFSSVSQAQSLLERAAQAVAAPAVDGDLFSDPRLGEWSELWRQGRYDEFFRSLETNLSAGQPSRHAPYVWAWARHVSKEIGPSFEALDPVAQERVRTIVEAYRLYRDDRDLELLENAERFIEEQPDDFWLMMILSWSAEAAASPVRGLEYALAAHRLAPEAYLPIWQMQDLAGDDLKILRVLEGNLGELDQPVVEFLRRWRDRRTEFGPSDVEMSAPAWAHDALSWLELHPADPWALRRLGLALSDLKRFEQASESFRRSLDVFPFSGYQDAHATALLRLGRDEDARRLVAMAEGRLAEVDSPTGPLIASWADMHRQEGNHGRARALLGDAMNRWSDDVDVIEAFARLERADKRWAEEVPLRKRVVTIKPLDASAVKGLMGALYDDGKTAEALDEFYKYVDRGGPLTTGLANMAIISAQSDPRYSDTVALALAAFPNSQYVRNNIASDMEDQPKEAIEKLLQSFHRWPHSWTANRLLALTDQVSGTTAGDELLGRLRNLYPWMHHLWDKSASRIEEQHDDAEEHIIALWRDAVHTTGRPWARRDLISALLAREQWDEARRVADDWAAEAEDGIEAVVATRASAWVSVWKVQHTETTQAEREKALDRISAWEESGGSLANIHRYRSEILVSLDRHLEAAQEMERAAVVLPDWDLPADRLAYHLRAAGFGLGRARAPLYTQTVRRPYGDRLENLMQVQTLYHPIDYVGALHTSAIIAQRSLDLDVDFFEQSALSGLGLSAEAFRKKYGTGSPVGDSLRYVWWYESARAEAERRPDSSEEIQIHALDHTIVYRNQGGYEESWTTHPISGRPTRIELGGFWVEIDYDEHGDKVERLNSSTGVSGEVEYGERESVLIFSDGRRAWVARDESGQIVSLGSSDVGSLSVTYDEEGEIESVEVLKSDGEPADALARQDVLDQIRFRVQPLSVLIIGEGGGSSPIGRDKATGWLSLFQASNEAWSDIESEAQRSILAADLGDDEGTQADAVSASLRAARHASSTVTDRAEAIEDLEHWAFEATKRALEMTATPEHAAVLTEAFALWLQGARAIYPRGVPDDRWFGLYQPSLERLRTFAEGHSDPGVRERASVALEELADSPLEQQKPAAWLTRSWLRNPGYWRRWSLNDIGIPRSLTDGLRLNCALVRDNGQVVVGTDIGLCVFTRGHWVWLVFDEKTRRLTPGVLYEGARGASSDILCLAEDAKGRLLVGTAHGLIRVVGFDEESNAAHWWRTEAEGLPSGRILSLVATASGTIATTAKGFAVVTEAGPSLWGPTPAELGEDRTAAIRFARLHEKTFSIEVLDMARLFENISPLFESDDERERTIQSLWRAAGVDPQEQDGGRTVAADDENIAAIADILAPFLGLTDERFDAEQIQRILGEEYSRNVHRSEEYLLFGTSSAVYSVPVLEPDATPARILDRSATGVCSVPGWPRPLALCGEDVFGLGLATSENSDPVRLPGGQNVLSSRTLYGLAPVRLNDEESVLAVLTDEGASLHNGESVEHLDAPDSLVDRRVGFRALVSGDAYVALVSDDGVFVIDRGRAHQMRSAGGPVRDIVHHAGWDMTFFADGERVGQLGVTTDGLKQVTMLRTKNARLAIAKDGALLAFDGTQLVRWAEPDSDHEVLFQTDGTPTDPNSLRYPSLLVDSVGRIWCAVGCRLYCLEPGSTEPKVWSYFDDAESFPARSDMLANVIETYDGRIWVIASNEEHRRSPDGVWLVGGVLELDGDRFVRVETIEHDDPWFITGYATIDDGRALASTADGLAWHTDEGLELISTETDPGFGVVDDRVPTKWLGSRPLEMGDGLWLVGTSSGVIGWREGSGWFVADRMNWMLPRQELSQLGGRHVYAMAKTTGGDLVVGSTYGAMLYRGMASDPLTFLASEGLGGVGFDIVSRRRLKEELDVLLRAQPQGEAARLVRRLRDIEAALSRRPVDPGHASQRTTPEAEGARRLREELHHQNRVTLMRLRRKYPAVFQLVDVRPLDYQQIARGLEDNQALIQYWPTTDQLYIHIVRPDHPPELVAVRNVTVSDLRSVILGERPVAGGPVPAMGTEPLISLMRQGTTIDRVGEGEDENRAQLDELRSVLHSLYNELLRPAEPYLEGVDELMIVPADALCYVPFAALIHDPGASDGGYAVSKYAFSFVHSIQLLDLLQSIEGIGMGLVVANPSGDLKGADREAERVVEVLRKLLPAGVELVSGKQATRGKIERLLPMTEILHIASHARFDAVRPENSYVELADDRLDVATVMALPLRNARLVVLSACETAAGGTGLEYSIIARSFINGGANRVIATLGPVSDAYSGDLMEQFYLARAEDLDEGAALQKAQHEIITSGGQGLHPAAWAQFILIGRP